MPRTLKVFFVTVVCIFLTSVMYALFVYVVYNSFSGVAFEPVPLAEVGEIVLRSIFPGLLLSLLWYEYSRRRAYEEYFISEAESLNEKYLDYFNAARKKVFSYLEVLAKRKSPEEVLTIGNTLGKAHHYFEAHQKSNTLTWLRCRATVVMLLDIFPDDPVLKKFYDFTESLSYPLRCKRLPTLRILETNGPRVFLPNDIRRIECLLSSRKNMWDLISVLYEEIGSADA